jgi:hypothetical protein
MIFFIKNINQILVGHKIKKKFSRFLVKCVYLEAKMRMKGTVFILTFSAPMGTYMPSLI